MSHTSRRKFLKGIGAALASVDVAGAAVNTPAVAHSGAHDGSTRQTLTIEALSVLVVEQLSAWAAAGRTFTAYDVTRELRHQHRNHFIGHDDVRSIVHDRMALLTSRQRYGQRLVQFPTGVAIEYMAL